MTRRLDAVGIGSMVVDRIHRIPKILSADQKTILDGEGEEEVYVGGVVLNHLGWAAALGLEVGIFGKQAEDANGRFLRAAIDRHGIERNLVLDGSATSFAHVFVDDEGGRAIYMSAGATAETTAEHVRTHHAEFIARARWVTTEVSQLPLPAVQAVLDVAREAGVPSLLDLDVPPSQAVPGLGSLQELDGVLRSVEILKPSKSAARELVSEDVAGDALAVAEAVRARFGSRAVVVTDGAEGCAIAAAEGSFRVPSPKPARVLDTTGAGDAFLGGLLTALQLGLDWPAAGRLANAAGAACVEKLGAFPDLPIEARERVLELHEGVAPELPPLPRLLSEPGAEALGAFDVALAELGALRQRLDPAAFDAAVDLIRGAEARGGRVHVTGVGKPEHVAHYAASLLSSTGTPATFLHGTEAVHGSAGQVLGGDVVIAISNSGETEEVRDCVSAVRELGARVIAVTGNLASWLSKHADVTLEAGVAREGGGLGFAPRASVAAELLVLASLGAALETERGFRRDDYAARHPAGTLGRRSRGDESEPDA